MRFSLLRGRGEDLNFREGGNTKNPPHEREFARAASPQRGGAPNLKNTRIKQKEKKNPFKKNLQ